MPRLINAFIGERPSSFAFSQAVDDGVAFADSTSAALTAGTSNFTEDWAGLNGSSWNQPPWTIFQHGSGATVIRENTSGHVTAAAGYNGATTRLSRASAGVPNFGGNLEASWQGYRNIAVGAENYVGVHLRRSEPSGGYTSYSIEWVGDVHLYKTVAGVSTELGRLVVGYPSVYWGFKFKVFNTTISLKAWDLSVAEPAYTTWTDSVSPITPESATEDFRYFIGSGLNTAQDAFFKNLVISPATS